MSLASSFRLYSQCRATIHHANAQEKVTEDDRRCKSEQCTEYVGRTSKGCVEVAGSTVPDCSRSSRSFHILSVYLIAALNLTTLWIHYDALSQFHYTVLGQSIFWFGMANASRLGSELPRTSRAVWPWTTARSARELDPLRKSVTFETYFEHVLNMKHFGTVESDNN